MVRGHLRSTAAFATAALGASSAWACPLCESETGERVRAGIFNADFGYNLAVTVLPFGWLTDRLGPKNVLMIGMAFILVAAMNGLWVTTLPQITVVLCLAGIGNAAQTASAYPLLTKVVPREEVGFYTGLQSTALSIAAPLTAILTGELVNKGGYRLIFAVCGVGLLVTLFFLTRVRMAAAVAEIADRNREQGRTA